jgi:protein-S-isoprenylcysteine O-methyltransferase Ste14
MYFVFKANIEKEYEYLRDKLGCEYTEYGKRINEILPIPKINKKR